MTRNHKTALLGASVIALSAAMAGGAAADPILPYAIPLQVLNPNFTQYSGSGTSTPKNSIGLVNPTSWTVTRPSRTPNSDLTGIDAIGTATQFGHSNVAGSQPYGIWPYDPSNPKTANVNAGPPSGGNFLQMDGNQTYSSVVSQTLNNLTPGQQYYIGFYQASGQQNGSAYTADTTDYWRVFLGNPISVDCKNQTDGPCTVSFNDDPTKPTQTTVEWDSPTMINYGKGSTPWTYVQSNLGGTNGAVIFTAYATTETLSYFAYGTNQGANQPPTLFLSGFNQVNSTPEPATLGVLGAGLGGLGMIRRLRKKRAAS
jgi:hypothetical protein